MFYSYKEKRLARTTTIPARLVNLMKSCFAGWNPSELGWNLRCATSDKIKSAILTCHKADFIAQRFHPQSGFIPTKTDLTEKDSELYPILSLFLVGGGAIRLIAKSRRLRQSSSVSTERWFVQYIVLQLHRWCSKSTFPTQKKNPSPTTWIFLWVI